MNIYNYLKKDHKKVANLMNDLLHTDDIDQREQIFLEIKRALLLHAKTKHNVFYKILEHKKATEENIEEAEDDHKEIEKYLKELSNLDFNSSKWLEKFGEFKHSVTHHIHEEEDVVFPKAKKILSDNQAEELTIEMDQIKHDGEKHRIKVKLL